MVEEFINDISTQNALKTLPIPEAMDFIEARLLELADKKEQEQVISKMAVMNLPHLMEGLTNLENNVALTKLQEKDILNLRKEIKQIKERINLIEEACNQLWEILKCLKKR